MDPFEIFRAYKSSATFWGLVEKKKAGGRSEEPLTNLQESYKEKEGKEEEIEEEVEIEERL